MIFIYFIAEYLLLDSVSPQVMSGHLYYLYQITTAIIEALEECKNDKVR